MGAYIPRAKGTPERLETGFLIRRQAVLQVTDDTRFSAGL